MSRIAERALEDIVRRRLAGIVVRHSRFKSWVREIVKDVHRVEVIDKTDRATRWIGLRCEDEAAAQSIWIAFAKTESLLSIGRSSCLPMSIYREAWTRLFVCAAPQFSSLDQSGLAAARTTCRDLLTMRKPLAKAGACARPLRKPKHIRFWHIADLLNGAPHVRFWGNADTSQRNFFEEAASTRRN